MEPFDDRIEWVFLFFYCFFLVKIETDPFRERQVGASRRKFSLLFFLFQLFIAGPKKTATKKQQPMNRIGKSSRQEANHMPTNQKEHRNDLVGSKKKRQKKEVLVFLRRPNLLLRYLMKN